METERPSPRYSRIDAWEPGEILDAMIEGQLAAVAAVRAARASLERAALAIERRLIAGGRLVYVGAGTSGRLAVQDGAELAPTFGWPQDRLLLLIAGGEDALLKAVEGAEDESARAVELMRRHAVGRADVLIALAASGTTPFTLACLREARRGGALTIGVANNRNTPLLVEADHAIFLDTGPEVIAGSTRMKAGAAQRTALLMLSSLVMILLGRVYEGLMVDVQASNKKLVRRSEKILARLTGRGAEEIDAALRRAGGSVKLAFLLLQGWERAEAEAALCAAHGHLRRAFTTLDARRGAAASQTPGGSTVGLKKPTPS
jgi:N-acetylmuramic acid 6-phosphate etherase